MLQLWAVTKRKKGHKPIESAHPNRPEVPDMPGHQQGGGQGGARVVVGSKIKDLLKDQIDKLREEILRKQNQEAEGSQGGENKG